MKRRDVLLLPLALGACGGNDEDAADYFPVAQGATWTYRATTWTQPGSWTTTVTVTGMAAFRGLPVWVFREDNRRRVNDPFETYYAKDAAGVTYVGDAPVIDLMMDAMPWPLLRANGAIGPEPLLDVRQISAIDAYAGPMTIDLKIIAHDGGSETVTTPAGTFDTRVFGYEFIAMLPGSWGGTYESRHWLAEWRTRGIGSVRQKYATGVQFASTNWVKELESYSIRDIDSRTPG
jgi:hypothetical protein